MKVFTSEQQQEIEELFGAASSLSENARAAFLAASSADPALVVEVERLLNAFKQAGRFMETDALNAAAKQGATNQANSPVGDFLSHYQILEPLGRGGMGEVYRARDSRLGREVAIKVLPSCFASDQELLRRFQQEARAASALNHQNILIVHDLGEANSTPFIATELIRGITLRERLDQGQLSLGESLRIATQIADALVAAHSARIIHRDIKPANVMLREDGTAKILDFGIAKFTERLIKQETSPSGTPIPDLTLVDTVRGTFIGTYEYASPEQLLTQDTDERTDVWSLGIVLYEMIAGITPFKGSSLEELRQAILIQEPAPLEGPSLEVSNELQRIIAKALSKDRKQRYQTIDELFVDLKTLLEQVEFVERTGLATGDQGLFVGENSLHYLMSWRMSERMGLPVFNWTAFLLPMPWLAYRKMYFYLGALLMFSLGLCVLIERSGLMSPNALLIVLAVWMLGLGVFGNTIYRRQIAGKLRSIKQKDLEPPQQIALIKRTGGTNKVAGGVSTMLLLISIALIPKYLVFPREGIEVTDRSQQAKAIASEASLLLTRGGNLLLQVEALQNELGKIQDPEGEKEQIKTYAADQVKLLTQVTSLMRESSAKFDQADKLLDQGNLKKHFNLMTQATLKYAEMSDLARQQAEVLLKIGTEPLNETMSRYEQLDAQVRKALQEASSLALEGREMLIKPEAEATRH